MYGTGLLLILMHGLQLEVDYETMYNKIKSRSGDIYVDLGNHALNNLVNSMVCKKLRNRLSASVLARESAEAFPHEEW